MELTDVMTQIHLLVIYRTFHPNSKVNYSSQHVIESSQNLITNLVTKQVSPHIRNLKFRLYPIRSPWIKVGFQQHQKKESLQSQGN